MGTSIYFWIGFHVFIFLMLALDLGVFHKKSRKLSVGEAFMWSLIWIGLALVFNLFIYLDHGLGHERAVEFFTGYVIEYSLSVDNIFVFILIFSYFSVKDEYQHKILFWGILGALVMRGLFIIVGITLVKRFDWIVLIFGVFLVYTGIHMLFREDVSVDPEKNAIVRFFRKFLPVSEKLHGDKLFIRQNKMLYATPLFLVLLIIESSDVIFAVDS
ncbi:MAG TPA: TerC/Alx family metal homeostasis membrane protein, partial [Bacteroidales bacterium]|nr:TerC/Alx family metal homeostasis membrane protein [Bacteroidales bacterium]